MTKMLLAAAAAFAFLTAAPALACPDCKDCPMHKVAQADKKDAKDPKVACNCAKTGGECKCGEKCDCPHCHGAKAEKKDDAKKT